MSTAGVEVFSRLVFLLSQLIEGWEITSAATDAIRVYGWFSIGLFLLINAIYLLIHTLALGRLNYEHELTNWEPAFDPNASPFLPSIAVLIPAYNEEQVILDSVESALRLKYDGLETIVINDGSEDDTLAVLRDEYDLQRVSTQFPVELPCEAVDGVYRSVDGPPLYVIDKENGGRSDALNAGIWFTDQELFCTIDADTILDEDGLFQVVKPFLRNWSEVVATGGTVRVANGVSVSEGRVGDVRFPRNPLAGIQVLEYLRSFYSGRMGLDSLDSLIILSGAFGVFKTEVIREIGGYRTDTLTEDLDLVIRIHKHMIDTEMPYQVRFVPAPVAWTEVPESLQVFTAQRQRWYNGLIENLITHRDMFLNRRYRRVGLFALPAFLIAEVIGPVVEALGYLLLPLAVLLGVFNADTFLLFVLVTSGFGVFLSWYATYGEVWTFRRYRNVGQIASLMALGVVENFGYRQFKTFLKMYGLLDLVRGDTQWGVMERTGFDE